MSNAVTGESVSYQYDSLKRLISASGPPLTGSSTTPWVQSFSYDGFGNLTGKTLNGTTTSIAVNAATNRLTNASYDANGNMTSGAGVGIGYDSSNRVASVSPVSGGTAYYGYDASNRRIYSNTPSGGEIWTFYGGYGERLGTFNLVDWSTRVSQYQNQWTMPAHILSSVVWFGGQIVWDGGTATEDRLGTRARVYPYGEEIGTATANDRVKFATYTRDAFSGLDYAQQRWYASSYGRFTSADPYQASAGASDPGSWNRYAYVEGDPVNNYDPQGLQSEGPPPDGCNVNGMWSHGCFAGTGPSRFAPVTAFTKAAGRLAAAAQAFEDRGSFSPQCQRDIAAIAAGAPGYIDSSQITIENLQAHAGSTTFQNGVGSQVFQSALYPTSPQAAAVVANQTIGSLFSDPTKITTAVTTLGGNTIYIDPSRISSNITVNEGLLIHELLHELGLTDDAIGTGLQSIDPSIRPDQNGNWTNSQQFSNKLGKDCFAGKDNRN